ncbi:hypothetical protein ACWGJ2_32995 [Streptomyces sp. NPDC054796]
MTLRNRRWLLAPLRQLRTQRLIARHGPTLPYDTAWALIGLSQGSEGEGAAVRTWARENPDGPPGIHHDHWHDLSAAEQRRRRKWLQRHRHSPVQLLRLNAALIHSTGLHVLDWDRPPEETAGSHPHGR